MERQAICAATTAPSSWPQRCSCGWQNGKEERFNGTVRDECLNLHVFSSLAEAHVRLSAFRQHYNTERPHSRLGYLTPLAFKAAWLEAQAKLQDPLICT